MILPTATEVLAAAHRMRGVTQRTPCARSEPLSERVGGDAYFKWENEQTTGSFKLRGALNVLLSLTADERSRGVVASSAGNHGLGLAHAGHLLGVKVKVFIPSSAPRVKRDGILAMGAEVDESQSHYDAAYEAAVACAEREGKRFVSPCSGRPLLAGQGTVGLEILEDLPTARTLVVPVGGGGLVGGIAVLVRAVAPHVRIVGAQSAHTNAMAASLAARRRTTIPPLPTIADGLAGQVDDEGLLIGHFALDDVVVVPESQIADAMAWLSHAHGARVEGAGAASAAAVLSRGGWETPVVAVVTGGNVDDEVWSAVMREATTAA